jgi:beta-lactamase regulating signal transducer with metallopeptidase domain
VIVLPSDWRHWDEGKLDAVLAHERSHIRRHDPAVQLLSAIHRALLWHSPLSWFLHKRIVCVAEEASDDAALVATSDRAFYAETLLGFMVTVHASAELRLQKFFKIFDLDLDVC